jgi:hypothetical protein
MYGIDARLCVVFTVMVLNIMKGLRGGHFQSEQNVINDTTIQQFSSKNIKLGIAAISESI